MHKKSPEPVERYIGCMVMTLRRARGWSQSQLAEKIGVSFQQVQEYEHGKDRVAASTLLRIAKAMDFPVLAFLPDDPDDPFGVLFKSE